MFTEEIFLVKEANTSNLKANTLKKKINGTKAHQETFVLY